MQQVIFCFGCRWEDEAYSARHDQCGHRMARIDRNAAYQKHKSSTTIMRRKCAPYGDAAQASIDLSRSLAVFFHRKFVSGGGAVCFFGA